MKQIAMLVLITAIFSIGMATVAYGINSSNQGDPTIPGHKLLSPKSFGSKNTQVCGDKLCDFIGISDTLTVVLSSGTN